MTIPKAAQPGALKVGGSKPADAAVLNLLNNARSRRGEHEGPNNHNQYTKRIMGDANQPWCAAFVSVLLAEAKLPGISGVVKSASSEQLAGQFQNQGRYFARGAGLPQPGDVIFFGGRGSEHHTGIVQKVENGKVYTIEGNSSDKVSERVYPLSSASIGGYGRVFGEGQVSGDLGLDVSGSTAGRIGDGPGRRSSGAGASSIADATTGIDPISYHDYSNDYLTMLLEALKRNNGERAAEALANIFPYASMEDLTAVAELLTKHPELAEAIKANPEVLQRLVANPTEDTVKQLLSPEAGTPVASAAKNLSWSAPSTLASEPWTA
jgi:hypothetical protein